ncbi:MAG: hypothetical protein JKY66_09880 [Spongiibacteraceae bacterium]|nr:hypothetical protein [Spongiibacteraceae bacterium]
MIATLSSIHINAEPCNCLWHGSFANIADRADLIVSGQIIRSKGNAMDLHIDRILIDKENNGKEFNEDIRIWADNGSQCRPQIDLFAMNSHWLMALYKITENVPYGFDPNTPNISYGRVNDYYLSKCGAYWLALHDDYVSGNLIKGRRWEWDNKKMNPVLLDLIDAYVNRLLPKQALIEAAKPQIEAKKLMEKTKIFLDSQ